MGMMFPSLAIVTALSVPSLAPAVNVANVSPKELARAIDMDDGRAPPRRKTGISASDIRISRCIGPGEEPTEFECTWRQFTAHRWVVRKTRLAIDGQGWHVID